MDRPHCPACGAAPTTKGAKIIESAGEIVVLALERSRAYDPFGIGKIVTPVRPTGRMQLAGSLYQLRALVIHHPQGANSGHYTALI